MREARPDYSISRGRNLLTTTIERKETTANARYSVLIILILGVLSLPACATMAKASLA